MIVIGEPRRKMSRSPTPLGPRAAREEESILAAFEDIDRVEKLGADALAAHQSTEVEALARTALDGAWRRVSPVRVRVAAELLRLDTKSVRAWMDAGVLEKAQGSTDARPSGEGVEEGS